MAEHGIAKESDYPYTAKVGIGAEGRLHRVE
jgi:hypothetical protein